MNIINIKLTDELLNSAKIAAWMSDQEFITRDGKKKPFNPKTCPNKSVTVMLVQPTFCIELYFDAEDCKWDSKVAGGNIFTKLDPDQMADFFASEFYCKLSDALSKKWPLSDPTYQNMFSAIQKKCLRVGKIPDEELKYAATIGALTEFEHRHDVDQPNKRRELANKDITGDGKRDYTASGRRIVTFSDNQISSKKSKYYCWPRAGKEFKWNTWKDWKKQKPFCKMVFNHAGRNYMIQASLFDEQFDNRGFRGADIDWKPPFGWISPVECESAMSLSCVQRFLRQCKKRIKKYISMTPEEIYEKIDKPERVTLKDIEKTQRVIRHCISVLFDKGQNDNYTYK